MARTDTFHCSVITPERTVLECEAKFVAFPAHDGEMGILPHHAPLICQMGIGPLRVHAADQTHLLFVDGGFAQVVHNRLALLADQAQRAEEIDAAKANQALAEAKAMRIHDEASFQARSNALRRAQAQLKLANR